MGQLAKKEEACFFNVDENCPVVNASVNGKHLIWERPAPNNAPNAVDTSLLTVVIPPRAASAVEHRR